MGPVGNAQGCRVGVYAVGNHSVEDAASRGQLVTGQESHNARITVVELGRTGGADWVRAEAAKPPPTQEPGQHSQATWH